MQAEALVVSGYDRVRPVTGGNSREVFFATAADGTEVVLRVYGAGNRHRGPEAPGVHAAVLQLIRGLVPAPTLLDYRERQTQEGAQEEAQEEAPEEAQVETEGAQGLVVTSIVPGVILADVLDAGEEPAARSLGASLGEVLGRLSGIAMTGPGDFLDATLGWRVWHPGAESLVTWLDLWLSRPALTRFTPRELRTLREVCLEADALLAVAPRACLVHGDLSPRNVMCDPDQGLVTGLIDWEFAHSGHPMEDAGHQLRERPWSPFVAAMLEAMNPWLPPAEQGDVDTLRRRARAADLYWIIEIASRLGEGSATVTCHSILSAIAATGDLLADDGRRA